MKRMKRILIPTDFSDNAWNAILYAIEAYRDVPCEFYLLNTYELNPVQLLTTVSSQRIGRFYQGIKVESEQGLKMILDDIQNSKPGLEHNFKTISKSGSLLDTINRLVQLYSFDMIVMGTKGATGVKEAFLGSNTQKVIKNISNCPILVVPEDVYFEKISEIAFATDFKRLYHKAEISPILDFAKNHNATIRMIHVYDQPGLDNIQHYNSNTLEQYFKKVNYDFHVISDFSTTEKAIQACIEELEINLLIMINYEHSFIERLTKEPVIKKMTFHTNIPFLVIPSDD